MILHGRHVSMDAMIVLGICAVMVLFIRELLGLNVAMYVIIRSMELA
jgi:hypothetical protein